MKELEKSNNDNKHITKLSRIFVLFWRLIQNKDSKKEPIYPKGLVQVNDKQYIDDETWQHRLDVYYPENYGDKKLLPVIIDIHGGGWMYGDKEINKNYCLHLAKCGYVVFNLNYRLFPQAAMNDQLADVANALMWIRDYLDEFPCDKNNIYITGDSAGGQLCAFISVLSTSKELRKIFEVVDFDIKFNAVALISPVGFMDEKLPMSIYTKRCLGVSYKSSTWSDYVNFDKLLTLGTMPPTFLVTCSGDLLIRRQVIKIANILEKKGIEHQLMDWCKCGNKNLKHVFSIIDPESEESIKTINSMCDFFKKYEKCS